MTWSVRGWPMAMTAARSISPPRCAPRPAANPGSLSLPGRASKKRFPASSIKPSPPRARRISSSSPLAKRSRCRAKRNRARKWSCRSRSSSWRKRWRPSASRWSCCSATAARSRLSGALADAPAILVTWFLGTESGHAVADILFGDFSPSARLTASFPRKSGQEPYYYAHKSDRPAQSAGTAGSL